MKRILRIEKSGAKAVQAALICGLIFAISGWIWPSSLHLTQLWIVALVGVLANVFQPPYRAFEASRTEEDKGTARQIVWTVYITQTLAVAELAFRRRVSLPLDWIAVGAAIAVLVGLALRTWAVIRLGRWFTWNVTVQPEQVLVTDGPYRFIRHPSYTGALLMFVGSCVFLRSYLAALFSSVLLLIAFLRRIRHEEPLMLATFPQYKAYKDRTGSLVPRIDRLSSV